jgi:uncharacterized phage protein gp47/JayE
VLSVGFGNEGRKLAGVVTGGVVFVDNIGQHLRKTALSSPASGLTSRGEGDRSYRRRLLLAMIKSMAPRPK